MFRNFRQSKLGDALCDAMTLIVLGNAALLILLNVHLLIGV